MPIPRRKEPENSSQEFSSPHPASSRLMIIPTEKNLGFRRGFLVIGNSLHRTAKPQSWNFEFELMTVIAHIDRLLMSLVALTAGLFKHVCIVRIYFAILRAFFELVVPAMAVQAGLGVNCLRRRRFHMTRCALLPSFNMSISKHRLRLYSCAKHEGGGCRQSQFLHNIVLLLLFGLCTLSCASCRNSSEYNSAGELGARDVFRIP